MANMVPLLFPNRWNRLSSGVSSNHDESSPSCIADKLARLQLYLETGQDLTRSQPPQAPVISTEDGNLRVVLLTTAELYWKQQAIESRRCSGVPHSPSPSNMLRGSDFLISERYRCLADQRGQAQGGVGFIFEGVDLAEGTKVAVKFFHQTDDKASSARANAEIVTSVRLHRALHCSTYIDRDDERDIFHLTRLRDILIEAPIFEDCAAGHAPSSVFRATALVFDWADAGDAQSLVCSRGVGIAPAYGARVFHQVLRGLRALHRRGIVHRDIKPENILLAHGGQMACLCDFGFAKHVPSMDPAELTSDPTTCYQSPEQWSASDCHRLGRARSPSATAGSDSETLHGGGETSSSVFASDIFSAGVSLFVLVAYHAVVARLQTEVACGDVGEVDESKLPAMNLFQHTAGGEMFGLLQAKTCAGGVQERLWAYWEVYGLQLPPALRGLLDGVLHPVPERRFSMAQAFEWMDSHPSMFSSEEA